MRDLAALLSRFPTRRVLVIGDVILDEYVSGDCSRLSPEAPVPVVTVSSSREVLGGAANTAANVAALGGRAVLVGGVGRDDAGARLLALATRLGIETVPVVDARPTVRKVRVLGQQRQLLRMDYESAASRTAPDDYEVLALVRERLADCDIVVVSDYAKGFLTRELVQHVIAAAHDAGRAVVVDPRPQHAAFYAGCDVLTPNWRESLGLLGIPDAGAAPDRSIDIGRQLAARFGCQVLLTLGARGMQYFGRDGTLVYDEPTQAREVFDVSGAGDTVVAALALALAAGSDAADAVALANRAAGIVVGKLGTATVSPGELLPEVAAARLVARADLAALATRLRAEGKRVVTVNGSFDLLHAGHLHILREARGQGDVLIVGVNSDRSVREYKGATRPIVGEADRAAMLLALKDVDYVHVFDETVPMPFLDEVRPDVHVNGSEYGADCIEAPTVRAHGGRVHIVEKVPGLSTSALLDRVRRDG